MPSQTTVPNLGRMLPTLLLLLTVFGPISMDLYLPALPALTADLGAATSVAQLTVTACLIGLAAGQLIAGPLSDRFGRRGILLIGIIAYIATSALCAISPTVELLIAARFVQGLAGGVGIVIAQAAGRDIYSGGALIRFYGRLTVVGGFAAIVGPLLGGLLNSFTDWRGLFVFLAVIGAGILVVTLLAFRETLPAEGRTRGGFGQHRARLRTLLSDRVFLGAVLNQGFLYAALFAYLAGSTFVLQDIYGLTPLGYALAFGVNSAGFMMFGYLAGRSAERWSIRGTLAVGILSLESAPSVLLASGITVDAAVGRDRVAVPPRRRRRDLFSARDHARARRVPADGRAPRPRLLGMVRFGFGGIAAPLVGVAGALSILPLGLVTTVSVLLAGAALFLLARSKRTVQDAAASSRPHTHQFDHIEGETPPCVRVIMYAPGDVRVEDRDKPDHPRTHRCDHPPHRRPASADPTCGRTAAPSRCIDAARRWATSTSASSTRSVPTCRHVKVGDFVVGSFVASDNTCEICQAGYQSRCVHNVMMGAIGTQSEYARIPLADGTLVATPGSPTPT